MKYKARTANSTYKKFAVQWLNKALCFVSSSVVAESYVLRNRQLLVAAKRWAKCPKAFAQQRALRPTRALRNWTTAQSARLLAVIAPWNRETYVKNNKTETNLAFKLPTN